MTIATSSHARFIDREIAGFDGIRGLAIVLVMLAHIGFASEAPTSLYPPGVLGVDIFMVLSGFLIVSALLKDFDRSGRMRFREFYLRRAARIFPALFMFLAVCCVISVWYPTIITPQALRTAALGALTFSLNLKIVWSCSYPQPLAHLWSLSLEEQFYLILPLTLLLLLKARRTALWITVAALPVVLSMLARYPECFSQAQTGLCSTINAAHGSQSRFMGQASGAILGCLWRFGIIDVQSSAARTFALISILTATAFAGLRYASPSCLGFDLACLGTIGLIIISLRPEQNPVKTLLLNRFLRYSGKLSYGLYLWHILVLWIFAMHLPLPRALSATLAIITAYGIAVLSYYFIELPVLRRVKGMLR